MQSFPKMFYWKLNYFNGEPCIDSEVSPELYAITNPEEPLLYSSPLVAEAGLERALKLHFNVSRLKDIDHLLSFELRTVYTNLNTRNQPDWLEDK